jgi:hypothetical protein
MNPHEREKVFFQDCGAVACQHLILGEEVEAILIFEATETMTDGSA